MRVSGYVRKNINIKFFDSVNTELQQNILPLKYSPLSYNFTCENGALRCKLGIRAAKTASASFPGAVHDLPVLGGDQTFKSIHVYRKYDFTNNKRDDKIIVLSSDNNYYETKIFEIDTFHRVNNLQSAGKDCSVCYRHNGADVFILSSENGFLCIYDGTTVKTVTNAPKMTSMCVHAERIFATVSGEQNRVWFSDDFNPENWTVAGTAAGYIDFDDEGGNVIKVVRFLNHVYVFRDFGVERLTAYGSQQDFTVSKLYVSSARIYPETIVSLGDRIVFLTDDGLHVCDGYNIKAVAPSLKPFLSRGVKDYIIACGLNGKYYLAADLSYEDNINPVMDEADMAHQNDSVVIYDVKQDSFCILRGVDVLTMCAVKIAGESSVLIAFNLPDNNKRLGQFDTEGLYFETYMPKYWTTGFTDLGYPSKIKTVREVSLVSSCDCTLGVDMDGVAQEYAVKGGSAPTRIVINRSGQRMRLYIKTTSRLITAIGAPTVVVDIV